MTGKLVKSIVSGLFVVSLAPFSAHAQSADELYPKKDITASIGSSLSISGNDSSIPSGNYSGIAWIGDNRYIVISDKKVDTETENTNSWQTISIKTNEKGAPQSASFEGSTTLKSKDGTEVSRNDAEGIVFVPKANSLLGLNASEGGTVFISAESDQKIVEYDLDGKMTGRQLAIPEQMGSDKIFPNYGFEALTYSPERRKFWTTTEQGLKADVTAVSSAANAVPTYLRMVCFGENMQMEKQYAYKTDAPTAKKETSKYAFGVPELTALPDGTLLVCEREFFVGDGLSILNSFVNIKLYRAFPDEAAETQFSESLKDLPEERFMKKELLISHSTGIFSGIANYEGMCLAPKTHDGSMNLLLINDSQNRYKDVLGEYIMNVTLSESENPSTNIKERTSATSDSLVKYNINGLPLIGNALNKATIVIAKGKKHAKF